MSAHDPIQRQNLDDCPRVTLWRQGSVLPADCAAELGLLVTANTLFIVVSHDCDLAERSLDKEPNIEVVEAAVVGECDPNLTHSKSTRLLHLQYSCDLNPINLELRASTKRPLDKAIIEKYEPDGSFQLSPEDKMVLVHWLAARYKRSAFPNALLERLGTRLSKAISKLASKNPQSIVGLFMDHDPDEELTDPDEPYGLMIFIVYSSEVDGAQETAVEIATVLRQRFEREFINEDGMWTKIELQECEAMADSEMSLANAKRLKLFRLDHLSLRESPQTDPPDTP